MVAVMRAARNDIGPEIQKVLAKGAVNIKKSWQAALRSSTHFAPVSAAVTYDEKSLAAFGSSVFAVEVGLEVGSPGSLGNIAHFGSSRGGGTVGDPVEFLLDESPAVEKYLTEAVLRSWS